MSGRKKQDGQRLQWHPAFGAALRITFAEEIERKELELQEEYLLSKKPPQIDVLIIKKRKDALIRKTIGRIFRQHNIVEYKAPDDNLSVNDFYKVYGYACFYQSNTNRIREIEPTEITITFVCNRYPREMVKHLKEVRGMRAEQHYKGIYYLKGDAVPMQLLITHELTQEENYWLQNLRTNLKAGEEISSLITRYEPYRDSKDYAAVMDLITRANWKEMEVEEEMCDALRELFADELEREKEKARISGHAQGRAEGRAQGRAEGRTEGRAEGRAEGHEEGRAEGLELAKRIFRLSSEGKSQEEIAEKCGLSPEQVREILE